MEIKNAVYSPTKESSPLGALSPGAERGHVEGVAFALVADQVVDGLLAVGHLGGVQGLLGDELEEGADLLERITSKSHWRQKGRVPKLRGEEHGERESKTNGRLEQGSFGHDTFARGAR